MWVIVELGIGTDPAAELRGNIVTDQKAAGTIHVAIGRNVMLGGINLAPLHVDAVVTQPTVIVHGTVIIDHGELLDGG